MNKFIERQDVELLPQPIWLAKAKGSYEVVEIVSLNDMTQFIDGWTGERDELFLRTHAMIHQAVRKGRPAHEARDAFVWFAARAGILVT